MNNPNSNNNNFRHRRNFKKPHGGSGGSNHRNDFRRSNNNHSGNNSSSGGARHPELDIVIDGKAVKKASMMRDKYQALARDAQSSGDRVLSENYLQHADHYNRILIAANELRPQQYRPVDASGEGFEETSFEAETNAGQPQNQPAPSEGNVVNAPVQQQQQVAAPAEEEFAVA